MRLFLKIFVAIILIHIVWNYRSCSYSMLKPIFSERTKMNAVMKVEQNYGAEIDEICEELEAPSEYFKALVLLECSAKKPAQSRYEPNVFKNLKAVREGKRKKYANLTQKDLKRYSEKELTMLATSWGPLQIMGYHVVREGLTIDDLNGEKGLQIAIQWCIATYGKYLEEGDYKNAFHIHNTGKEHPLFWKAKTYDPLYVDKGLIYISSLK
ncbi:hypothetical protein [Bernardetia sp.]|uniref:hypothetical protein n=1 Tax=Bernardetia sp. TaxID=1937974 RepID=UPI0025C1C01E|nr:hypothetical protein [Bernardetia sp.]